MYTIHSIGDAVVVTVDLTRIDAATANAFHHSVSKELEGQTKILFDLGKVEFMDSTGIGAIVGIAKRLGRGARIMITGLTPAVKTVFTLLRMDMLFAVHPTRDAAIAALQTP